MITLHDLDEAILECQGERNPNANTCIKLAAFYTIRQNMFGDDPESPTSGDQSRGGAMMRSGYSSDTGPSQPSGRAEPYTETVVNYDSGTEFSGAIDGLDAYDVWSIMDELMTVLHATNARLYDGVMRKIEKL